MATLVVQLPERFGLPLARWSVRELSRFLKERYGWQVSHVSISRFLWIHDTAASPCEVLAQPERTPSSTRKPPKSANFYVSPPANTTVLSLDEKPGIQALRRKHPTRPIKPGPKCQRRLRQLPLVI